MKKIAITVLLACSFLGAGCSPTEEEAPKGPLPSATMKPIVDPTQQVPERRREVPLKRVAPATDAVEPTPTPLEAPPPTIAP